MSRSICRAVCYTRRPGEDNADYTIMGHTKSVSMPADWSWDQYWRGMYQTGGTAIGGASHPRFREFWHEFFSSLCLESETISMIDVASGDGAVVESAVEILREETTEITCLEISRYALEILQRRFPAVKGIVADAIRPPLATGSFDVVTSQFGIEYAGIAAFDEVARLLAHGGHMACLIHHRSGAIYNECSESLDAVEQLKSSEFIPRAIAMFEAGFAACRGADRRPYDAAAQNLLPAFRQLEDLMQTYGAHVAGDTLLRLYNDVDNIHQRMEQYEPAEVLRWLAELDSGLIAYTSNMIAMRDAALGEPQFLALCDASKDAGLFLQQAVPLFGDNPELPIAWALIARSER